MLVSILIFVCASAYVSLSFIPVCKGGQVMRLFIVVLALAVAASSQAMAVAPLHQRHAKWRDKRKVMEDAAQTVTGGFRARAYLTRRKDRISPIHTGCTATTLPCCTLRAVASSDGVVRGSSPVSRRPFFPLMPLQ